MRIPLTKYGLPQVVVFPAVIIIVMVVLLPGTMAVLPLWAVIVVQLPLAGLLILSLSFFRDPHRISPSDKNLLLAPADGQVTDIEIVPENDFIGGAALRISIFLSIFNTHINRAPCNTKIEKITYKKGRYLNAMNPKSGQVNESNDLVLVRTDTPTDRLIVRQISGAIARRIVCDKTTGQELAGGEKIGMIKFGSRTELYLPAREDAMCLVKIGDKVKAGLTPLVRYSAERSAAKTQD
jgi:phosphatidylserine decarboxylase